MSDRTEIVKYIVDKVRGAGRVLHRGDLTHDDPLLLAPFDEVGQVIRVCTFERFNGACVLSIDLPLGSFRNIEYLRDRLWKMT